MTTTAYMGKIREPRTWTLADLQTLSPRYWSHAEYVRRKDYLRAVGTLEEQLDMLVWLLTEMGRYSKGGS